MNSDRNDSSNIESAMPRRQDASVVVIEEQISDRLLTSGSLAAGSSAMSDKEIMLCLLCTRSRMVVGHGRCYGLILKT